MSLTMVLRDIQVWKQERKVHDKDSEGHSSVKTEVECP
jgi:hypothetical protein